MAHKESGHEGAKQPEKPLVGT